MMERYKKIAQISARKVLAESNIASAPVDVVKIIEAMNIEYKETDEVEDSLSGFIKRSGKNGKPVIAVNANHSDERKRFTAAHELGHYMLHSMHDLMVDTDEEKVLYRKKDDSPFIDLKEIQANSFAAEILIPRDLLMKDVGGGIPTDDGALSELIKNLASKYNVSVQAMTIRLGSFIY